MHHKCKNNIIFRCHHHCASSSSLLLLLLPSYWFRRKYTKIKSSQVTWITNKTFMQKGIFVSWCMIIFMHSLSQDITRHQRNTKLVVQLLYCHVYTLVMSKNREREKDDFIWFLKRKVKVNCQEFRNSTLHGPWVIIVNWCIMNTT